MMPPAQDIQILPNSTVIALHTVLFKFSDCFVVPFVALRQVHLGRELANDGHQVAINLSFTEPYVTFELLLTFCTKVHSKLGQPCLVFVLVCHLGQLFLFRLFFLVDEVKDVQLINILIIIFGIQQSTR